MTEDECIAVVQYMILNRMPKIPDDWREQFPILAKFEVENNERQDFGR